MTCTELRSETIQAKGMLESKEGRLAARRLRRWLARAEAKLAQASPPRGRKAPKIPKIVNLFWPSPPAVFTDVPWLLHKQLPMHSVDS